jgi:hypothetical protein
MLGTDLPTRRTWLNSRLNLTLILRVHALNQHPRELLSLHCSPISHLRASVKIKTSPGTHGL